MELVQFNRTPLSEQEKINQDVVRGIAECMISYDLQVIIISWLRFRLERSSSPIERLKELFQMIMRNEMTFEIHRGELILFNNSLDNTTITLHHLSKRTQDAMLPLLTHSHFFYNDIDTFAIQYISLKRFKYNRVFASTLIWKQIVNQYIGLIMSPQIDERYLFGRGTEIVLTFVTDEIANIYEMFTKLSCCGIDEWYEKHEKYILNVQVIYKELNKALRPSLI